MSIMCILTEKSTYAKIKSVHDNLKNGKQLDIAGR